MLDGLRLSGRYDFLLVAPDGSALRRSGNNLVTAVGKNLAAEVLLTNSGPAPTATEFIEALSFGDSSVAPAEGHTTLQGSELISPRMTLAKARINNEIVYSLFQVYSGAAITVKEMGIFTTPTVGTGIMFSRFLPQQFTFPNGGILTFSYSLRIG